MRCRENWISFYTLFHREVFRVLRIWPQTLMPSVIITMMYFLVFGDIIGSRIGDMEGVPYINFIVPGLVMMSIINNAYLNTSSSFFGSKFQRNIEEMQVAPMPNWIIISGYVASSVVRAMIVGLIIIGVSLLFGKVHIYSWLTTITIALFTSVLFALGGLINGVFAKKFDDVSIVPLFILTPLIYLGGVFYSVDLLPGFWAKLTHVNPVFYIINGFRYGMIGKSDISISMAYYILGMSVVILYMFCVWLFRRGLGVKS